MSDEFGRLLTIADTAELLNLTVSEVTELVLGGELPAIRFGVGTWRIEQEVLRDYITGKYEEARRSALWNESVQAELPEFTAYRHSA